LKSKLGFSNQRTQEDGTGTEDRDARGPFYLDRSALGRGRRVALLSVCVCVCERERERERECDGATSAAKSRCTQVQDRGSVGVSYFA
jgi:hypothetical protein